MIYYVKKQKSFTCTYCKNFEKSISRKNIQIFIKNEQEIKAWFEKSFKKIVRQETWTTQQCMNHNSFGY